MDDDDDNNDNHSKSQLKGKLSDINEQKIKNNQK